VRDTDQGRRRRWWGNQPLCRVAGCLPPLSARELGQGSGPPQEGRSARGILRSRFTWARVRPAKGNCNRESHVVYTVPGEEWLLVEWPEGKPKADHYWLSTLPPEQRRRHSCAW